jgi:hypothetical protein
MDVEIHLPKDQCNCLSDHIPADFPLHQVFEPSQHIYSEYSDDVVLTCTRAEAESLLEVAREHCRGAMTAIHNAIMRASRSARPKDG